MTSRRLALSKRKVLLFSIIWPVVALASIGLTAWEVRVANLRELRAALPLWSLPERGERVVIVAPHCDDEVIGAAGLIHESLSRGAEVWVVLMTNGDGFRVAAAPGLKQFSVKPELFLELGRRRQLETTKALAKIGVSRSHIIFLGYPDRGLEPMWVSHWSSPYRSFYTKATSSPYSNSFTRNAPFTGEQVNADLCKVFKKIDPGQIYMTYPSDQHTDHWATSIFVAGALYRLGWWDTKTVGMYLVHKGDWPVPQGLHENVKLAPPAALMDVDTKWYELPLDKHSIELKHDATAFFMSQPKGTRRFLSSFVRQNELFATRSPELPLPRVRRYPTKWSLIKPAIQDAVADGMITNTQPSADIVSVQAARDSSRIYFRMQLAGKAATKTGYEIRVHPLSDITTGTTSVVVRRGQKPPAGWRVKFTGSDIVMSRPIGTWLNSPLLISAGTSISFYQVDRTAYSILTP